MFAFKERFKLAFVNAFLGELVELAGSEADFSDFKRGCGLSFILHAVLFVHPHVLFFDKSRLVMLGIHFVDVEMNVFDVAVSLSGLIVVGEESTV